MTRDPPRDWTARPPIYPAEWEEQSEPCYFLTLTWRPNPWEVASVSGPPAESHEQALANLLQIAKAMGYKPPRWWQWWRYGESRNAKDKETETIMSDRL